MTRWTCPRCARQFGRASQSHTCLPALSVADTFDRYPAVYASIYEKLIACLEELGPIHEDAVEVGVFLKTDRKLAEVRPKARWLSLDLILPRRIDHARVSRHITLAAGRVVHVIRLHRPADVDAWLADLLAQAFFDATRPDSPPA